MKSQNETVLLYNFLNKDIEKKLKALLVSMGVRIKSANQEMLNQKLGYLFGLKGFEKNEEISEDSSCDKELLALDGFTDARLNFLLIQIRKAGIPKIGYKAVLTPTNQNWTLKELYVEIAREHEMMSKPDSQE